MPRRAPSETPSASPDPSNGSGERETRDTAEGSAAAAESGHREDGGADAEDAMWYVRTTRRHAHESLDTEAALRAAANIPAVGSGDDATGDPESERDAGGETALDAADGPTLEDIARFVDRIPRLLGWLSAEGRAFPWRATDDEWTVYATEILLQRTRAETVADVHAEFFEAYPTPGAIVAADREDIRDAVASLGFGNRRAAILDAAATHLVDEHDGEVPRETVALRRPKGVGPYTARATRVFAHGAALGLVDTNTSRILGRVLGLSLPRRADEGDANRALFDAVTPNDGPAARAFNLALLDLGAAVCTPSDPDCAACPLARVCSHALASRRDDTSGDATPDDGERAPDRGERR